MTHFKNYYYYFFYIEFVTNGNKNFSKICKEYAYALIDLFKFEVSKFKYERIEIVLTTNFKKKNS